MFGIMVPVDASNLFSMIKMVNKDSYFFKKNGLLVCVDDVDEFVDLEGGSLAPGFTSYGSSLGPEEILYEPFTNDGDVYDPLVDGNLPSVLGKDTAIIRAVDGLQFNGRNTL